MSELVQLSIHDGVATVTFNNPPRGYMNAPQVDVSAGMVKVDAAIAKFSGIVKCETLISTSVVSTSYTPGAGNIW